MTGNKQEEIVDLRSDYVGQQRTLCFHELYLKGKEELSVFMRFDLKGMETFCFHQICFKGQGRTFCLCAKIVNFSILTDPIVTDKQLKTK